MLFFYENKDFCLFLIIGYSCCRAICIVAIVELFKNDDNE